MLLQDKTQKMRVHHGGAVVPPTSLLVSRVEFEALRSQLSALLSLPAATSTPAAQASAVDHVSMSSPSSSSATTPAVPAALHSRLGHSGLRLDQRVEVLELELNEARIAAEAARAEAAVLRESLATNYGRAEAHIAEVGEGVGPAISKALSLLRGDVELLAGKVAMQADAEAERIMRLAAEAEETRAALADVEEAVNQISAKAYDEQLLALQERLHGLDEELHAGQSDLKDSFFGLASLHGQVQEDIKTELRERISVVLETVNTRVKESMHEVEDRVDILNAQLASLARSDQVKQIVSEALLEGEESIKLILGNMEQATSTHLQRLAGEVFEAKEQARAAASFGEEVQQLSSYQQEARQAIRSISGQVVDLAARVIDIDIKTQVEELLGGQETLKEVYAILIEDLKDVKGQVSDLASVKVADSVTQEQLAAVVSNLGRVQQNVSEVKEETSALQAMASHTLTKEELKAIFAAKEDMSHAVQRLQQLFDLGGENATRDEKVLSESTIGVKASVTLTPSLSEVAETKAVAEKVADELKQLFEPRVLKLEDQVAELVSQSGVEVDEAIRQINTSVHDLQLMVLELRSEGIARALAATSVSGAEDTMPAAAEHGNASAAHLVRPRQQGQYSFVTGGMLGTDSPRVTSEFGGPAVSRKGGMAESSATEHDVAEEVAMLRSELASLAVKVEAATSLATAADGKGALALSEVEGVAGELVALASKFSIANPVSGGTSALAGEEPVGSVVAEPVSATATTPADTLTSARVDWAVEEVQQLRDTLHSLAERMEAAEGEAKAAAAERSEAASERASLTAQLEAQVLAYGALSRDVSEMMEQSTSTDWQQHSIQAATIGEFKEALEGQRLELGELRMQVQRQDVAMEDMKRSAPLSVETTELSAIGGGSHQGLVDEGGSRAWLERTAELQGQLLQQSILLAELRAVVQGHAVVVPELQALTGKHAETLAGMESLRQQLEELRKEGPAALAGSAAEAAVVPAGQAAFLHRLVEVVRKHSGRTRQQYGEEEELSKQLEEVDNQLKRVEVKLEGPVSQSEAQARHAEAMITILEQVAALRTIGSQTHPAIQQMLLSHEQQLGELQEAVKKVQTEIQGNQSVALGAAGTSPLESRVRKLEEAREHEASTLINLHAVGDGGEVFRSLALKISALEQHLAVVKSEPSGTVAGSTSGTGRSEEVVSALEAKVGEYGKVLQAMRNRVVALQEFIDSTQGMVKELHTVHGNVLARITALEQTAPAPAVSQQLSQQHFSVPGAGPAVGGLSEESLQPLKENITVLLSRVAVLQEHEVTASRSLEAALKLVSRIEEVEGSQTQLDSKLSAVGGTLPVLTGQVKSLERRLQARLSKAFEGLEWLMNALQEVSAIQKPSNKNPFSAIAPAGSNPAVLVLELRLEALRTALTEYSKMMSDDFRADVAVAKVSELGLGMMM
ncbi:hypothetical protein CEUSTIGMA_g2735.t1 [Chlamydomonas eustigma]|uniref:Uncharacterized protein n=1 Tax=Chlamydomonas eustigma TaxID=1157962 RepID=A0A250WXN2_9CHLO|nr:hypothetical protein CEUSTIGMA_g2735.t1 [Chlamydomonas eustigma]|eukprot:GAX75290.1 hypothetical protein CEUSTIGMA_g2735.t1 [Chlamydomonas eustigma]